MEVMERIIVGVVGGVFIALIGHFFGEILAVAVVGSWVLVDTFS